MGSAPKADSFRYIWYLASCCGKVGVAWLCGARPECVERMILVVFDEGTSPLLKDVTLDCRCHLQLMYAHESCADGLATLGFRKIESQCIVSSMYV